jgi:hypothetical protein
VDRKTGPQGSRRLRDRPLHRLLICPSSPALPPRRRGARVWRLGDWRMNKF